MIYDLTALFYEKQSDEKPRYKVPIGIETPDSFQYFPNLGFTEHPDNNVSYQDYIKRNVTEEELENLSQDGYGCELLDVLTCGTDFERIDIEAREIDVIDDEGNFLPRGFSENGIVVMLGTTDPDSVIIIIDETFLMMSNATKHCTVKLAGLKQRFDVLTQNEVASALRELIQTKCKTYNELINYL